MKLRTSEPYTSRESRERFARFLAATIEGQAFTPYMPNEGDDSYWTLDSGNNWKVLFFPDGSFDIRYRYQNATNQREEALAGWLFVRLDAIAL